MSRFGAKRLAFWGKALRGDIGRCRLCQQARHVKEASFALLPYRKASARLYGESHNPAGLMCEDLMRCALQARFCPVLKSQAGNAFELSDVVGNKSRAMGERG